MTEDKKFKRLVRAAAEEAGTNYAAARERLRPSTPTPVAAADLEELRTFQHRFARLVEATESQFFDHGGLVPLIAAATVAGAPVLCTDPPGTGQTALGTAIAAAVGAELVVVDGEPELTPEELPRLSRDNVIVVNAIDYMTLRTQRAVLSAGRGAIVLLAKRHPIAERVPFPLADEIVDRFAIGVALGPPSAEAEMTLMRIIRGEEVVPPARGVTPEEFASMRRTAKRVGFPETTRRQLAQVMSAIRADSSVVGGAPVTATLAVTQLAPVLAAAAGRRDATVSDALTVLESVLGHRLVLRSGQTVGNVLDRATGTVSR